MSIGHTTKWFSSDMGGAGGITNAAGQVISGILNKCLVTGFGSITVDSIVVSGGIATITKSGGHGFLDNQVIEIDGATPSALNDQHRFTRINANTGTIPVDGISDQTATGTITAKTPSLGFSSVYSATNVAVYQGNAINGYKHYLRVDDQSTASPRVRGYVTMQDINTGTEPYPSDSQMSGGGYFPKTYSATPYHWVLIGNDRCFYISVKYSGSGYLVSFFGDIQEHYGYEDPYLSILWSTNNTNTGFITYLNSYSNSACWSPRSYEKTLGSGIRLSALGLGGYSGSAYAPVSYFTYPPVVPGGGLIASRPVLLVEYKGQIRGIIPGYCCFVANCGTGFNTGDIIDITGFPDKIMFLQDYNIGAFGVSIEGWA